MPDMPNLAEIDRWLRWLVVASMAAVALDYGIWSIHWPLMLDSPVMHYVVFLTHHGFKPYSQIPDMNMPGANLTEAWAMHVFGTGDLAWRIYEFFLLAVLAGSLIIITLPCDWIAGVYGAGLFIAMHAAEGPRQAVERDEVLAVLLMVGYAALFTAVRRRLSWLALLFGMADGLAICIKPTFAPLAIAVLYLLVVALRGRRIPLFAYLAWATLGLTIAVGFNLGYLLRYGALKEFIFVVRMVIPAYRGGIGRPFAIAVRAFPKYILPLLPLAVACAIGNWRRGLRWNWERIALALGVACGLFSYFAQGKGLVYHRYEYLICLFPIVGMEAFEAMRGDGWLRRAGVAVLVLTMLFTVPMYVLQMHRTASNSELTLALESDLRQLGGAHDLQGEVQCFDVTEGCLNALYHLGLVENIPFTGDLGFFPKHDDPVAQHYHDIYWEHERVDPATVLVLGNEDFWGSEGFGKVHRYPKFDQFLDENFTQVIARSFPMEDVKDPRNKMTGDGVPAYRIYVRNGTALLESSRNATSH
jgi:hypothetical protein